MFSSLHLAAFILSVGFYNFCHASLIYSRRSDNSLLAEDGLLTRATQCGPGNPCADGSCCNSVGQCGLSSAICGGTATTHCISNCNATAPCGIYSKDGSQSCGLNTCCSASGFCGTTSIYCINADPVGLTAPCQKGFGKCALVPPPACSASSSSASKGRKIGYYQAGNVQNRACEAISPSQINTTGLTHLVYAFAEINPTTFNVTPGNPGDVAIYPKFTALKTATMQTWISIGGGAFSVPGPTFTTWSDMCSSAANRKAFITSLISFMAKWGFQGVDLDWEFPVQTTYGGRPTDTANLVSLTKELRAAAGTKYGISVALPPDFGSLQYFDPISMEPYVDFFNFMGYDIYGPWDASILGAFIRPQTDIRDISTAITPLWFDSLTPAKVNLGLALYGRGYTLSNKSCTSYPTCPYTGPSNPGPCTQSPGVLSLREIQQLIAARGLKPVLDPNGMFKIITWDNQWMAYDDADTIVLKMGWANMRCLGGSAAWSVDFNSGAGSGDPPASVWNTSSSSPKLTESPNASCGTGTSYTCLGSSFGNCCSSHGYCGSSSAYCSNANGCQSMYGTCTN